MSLIEALVNVILPVGIGATLGFHAGAIVGLRLGHRTHGRTQP